MFRPLLQELLNNFVCHVKLQQDQFLILKNLGCGCDVVGKVFNE
jgi:hypothetical protein